MIHRIKADELDFTKIKNICSLEDTIKKMKWQGFDWEKTFAKK